MPPVVVMMVVMAPAMVMVRAVVMVMPPTMMMVSPAMVMVGPPMVVMPMLHRLHGPGVAGQGGSRDHAERGRVRRVGHRQQVQERRKHHGGERM